MPTITRLQRADLDLGPKLGSGAQGTLFTVARWPSDRRAAFPADVVFKQFHPKTQVSGPALDLLARFRLDLDDHDREVIDAMTVWPLAVVDDGHGRACGYVMQKIPSRFFQPIATSAGHEKIAREIQQLFVPEAIARKNLGETANRVERMALARDAAFILGFLHKRDFVYGDFSYKNAVYCLRPHPGVMLLDCDAIRKLGQAAAVAQLHSPGWKPPEGGPQTKFTDRYKLGLCVLRCLTPGVNAQNRDPAKADGALDAEGMSLLRRALGDQPDTRTTGKEWVQYFNKSIAAAGGVKKRTGAASAPRPAPIRRQAANTRRPHTPSPAPPPNLVFTRGRSGALRVQTPASTPLPSTWVPTGPHAHNAFGNRAVPPPKRWSTAAPPDSVGVVSAVFGLLIILAALFGAVVVASHTTTSSNGPGTTSTARSTTRSSILSGTPMAAATVEPVVAVWSSSAEAAVDASATLAGDSWQLGQLRATTSLPDSTKGATLSTVPPQWVVTFIPRGGSAASATPSIRVFVVTPDGPVEQPNPTGARPRTPMPSGWLSSFRSSIELAARYRSGETVDVRWVCSPVAPTDDCRWRFGFPNTPATGAKAQVVWINPDGPTATEPPSWSTNA